MPARRLHGHGIPPRSVGLPGAPPDDEQKGTLMSRGFEVELEDELEFEAEDEDEDEALNATRSI